MLQNIIEIALSNCSKVILLKEVFHKDSRGIKLVKW